MRSRTAFRKRAALRAGSKIRARIPHEALLAGGILLIGTTLRAPFTVVGPLLGAIRSDLSLTTTAAGSLVTLPVLGFALMSPFSALFARRFGLERALFGALFLIAMGIVLRSSGPVACLYLGTALIGLSIAVANVLLPSLVKRDFPTRIAALTGAYALCMGVMAALASALAVPLAALWGWRTALISWLVLPLIALGVWSVQLRKRTVVAPVPAARVSVWRSPIAWYVTLFLGLNSSIYYVAVAWLPSILVTLGFSTSRAGNLQGVMQLASALPGLLFGPVVGRLRDQRFAAIVIAIIQAAGYAGFLAMPSLSLLWSALFGFGSGAAIILGLALTGLRARDATQAAALSGMAQCIGYALASIGPTAMAMLHDASGAWILPLEACVIIAALAGGLGWLAGKNRLIGESRSVE
jgi:MFS transporter, CP family, cyanate transporter